jgi:hypothetical protein
MPDEEHTFVLDEDDEVEDEYGDIMGAFVDAAEKDVLSQVCARAAVTPPAPMAHDGGWLHIYPQKPLFTQEASCRGR